MRGQLGLFGNGAPSLDTSFATLERRELEAGAWLDYAPGWLRGHEAVFEELSRSLRWRQESREMYEKQVDVPRLYAVLPQDGAGPPILDAMRRVLSARYGQEFERVSAAYYRDGRDSVAFHGDSVARNLPEALVATVSVGAPRRFLMRPKGGGRSIALSLGWGDLLVMGGTSQRTWQHAIPKVLQADPRISIMFRPVWSEDGY